MANSVRNIVVTLIAMGVGLPVTISVVGYCLNPDTSAYSLIGLGGILLTGALVAIMFLNKKALKNKSE